MNLTGGPLFLALILGVPFAMGLPVAWDGAGFLLLGGTIALAAAGFRALTASFSLREACSYLGLSLAVSWAAEIAGLHGGWLFGGRYRYNPALRPVLPGGVPLVIPLAWFVFLCVPLILLREVRVRHEDGSLRPLRLAAKAGLAGLFLAGCDLALEPIAIATGAWVWETPGPFFGAPWLNFAGWGAVGATISLLALGPLAVGKRESGPAPPGFESSWRFGGAAFMGLLGLAGRGHLASVLPLALCLLVTLPFWIYGAFPKPVRSADAGTGAGARAAFQIRPWRTRTNSSSLTSPKPGA